MRRLTKFSALWAVLLVLTTACGGGSGGSSDNPDPNNIPPEADAGANRSVNSNATVPLVGSASDPDGDDGELEISWRQIEGSPVVAISNANSVSASFFAPEVSSTRTLVFELAVTDERGATVRRTVAITLLVPESPVAPTIVTPIPEQTANEGDTVTLTAEASDADGSITRYQWSFEGAEPALLEGVALGPILGNNDDTAAATFTAPAVAEVTILEFELTVVDNSNAQNTASASAFVTVYPLPAEADDSDLYVLSSAGEILRYQYRPGPQTNLFIADQNFGNLQLGGTDGAIINDGMRMLPDGRLVAVDDDDNNGVRELCAVPRRTAVSSFDNSESTGYDRSFSQETLVENYGDVTVAVSKGYLIALDNFTDDSELRGIHVYGSTAAAGTPPLVASIPLGPVANGVMYLEDVDQLFVALATGRIAIYDDFIAEVEFARAAVEADETPGSTILADAVVAVREPASGEEVGINPQGMAYHAPSDRLIVVDAGLLIDPAAPQSAADGQLFVIGEATALVEGGFGTNAVADAVLSIPSGDNRLGDPVSVVLNGRDAVVADAGNDRVVVIEDVFALDGVSPPTVAQAIVVSAPTSLVLRPLDLVAQPSVDTLGSDQAAVAGDASFVLTTQFDSANNQMRIQRLSRDLGDLGMVPALNVPLTGDLQPAGLALDVLGNVYAASFIEAEQGLFPPLDPDVPGVTRLDVLNAAAKNRLSPEGVSTQDFRDRTILAQETTAQVETPLGMTIVDEFGVALIADGGGAGPAGIKVVSLCGVGGTLGANIPVEGNIPTGVDFDSRTGTLYVSLAANATNSSVGRFAIYQNFSSYLGSLIAGSQDNTPPNPSEVVSVVRNDGFDTAAAAGYTAIEYIPGADVLVLATNTQGQEASVGGLHVIRSANLAPPQLLDGQTFVDAEITGDGTFLQNPVDLAFDGSNLFVAELGNGRVLSFADITETSGGSLAPQAERDAVGIRGVVPVPEYVGTLRQRAVAAP